MPIHLPQITMLTAPGQGGRDVMAYMAEESLDLREHVRNPGAASKSFVQQGAPPNGIATGSGNALQGSGTVQSC